MTVLTQLVTSRDRDHIGHPLMRGVATKCAAEGCNQRAELAWVVARYDNADGPWPGDWGSVPSIDVKPTCDLHGAMWRDVLTLKYELSAITGQHKAESKLFLPFDHDEDDCPVKDDES